MTAHAGFVPPAADIDFYYLFSVRAEKKTQIGRGC